MDLSESVIMPREDFIELQYAAWNNPNDTTVGTRIASTVQTTLVCAIFAGAVAAGSWGWYKAANWYETKSYNRQKSSGWQFKTRSTL